MLELSELSELRRLRLSTKGFLYIGPPKKVCSIFSKSIYLACMDAYLFLPGQLMKELSKETAQSWAGGDLVGLGSNASMVLLNDSRQLLLRRTAFGSSIGRTCCARCNQNMSRKTF